MELIFLFIYNLLAIIVFSQSDFDHHHFFSAYRIQTICVLEANYIIFSLLLHICQFAPPNNVKEKKLVFRNYKCLIFCLSNEVPWAKPNINEMQNYTPLILVHCKVIWLNEAGED